MNSDEHIALADSPSLPVGQAGGIIQQIYDQLNQACRDEIVLEHSWMRLGRLLAECQSAEAWRPLFNSFDEFMLDLKQRFHRGRTQLWQYLTVARHLGPIIEADTLEEIGISKALEIKRGMKKNGGKPIPQEIIEAARQQTVTAKEIRARIAQAFNTEPDEKGTWFDLDGFFITKEEREQFVAAVHLTKVLLNLGKDVPEHVQRKAIIFAWLQEFTATHAAEINGPQQPVNTPAKLLTGGIASYREAQEPPPDLD